MSYSIQEERETRPNLSMFPTSDRTMSLGQGSLFDKKQEFNILEKLKLLRDNKVYCDVILIVRGVKLEAHKNVLAAWSPYFAAKLFPDRKEVFKDTILVNYESSEVFADLLDFMYNGYVAPRETNFLQLLHLAVSFQIEMLKNYCEEFLRCNLHLGNFVSTYFLSRKYKLDSLEEYIVGFLQLNLSDAVKQGEFLSLSARKFNTLLSKGWMEQIKPEIKLFLIISWVGYDVQEREKFLVLLLGHIDWSSVANDFLLEISRTENFFTSHESSLYLLLQTLFSAGIPIGPYTETFPALREAHEHILNEVVDTSLLQIEVESFYPATIVVFSRPDLRDQCINTSPCKGIDQMHIDVRDACINTDVNSEHFEKEEDSEVKCSTIIVEAYQEEHRADHHEIVGTLMIDSNAQEFGDVGKYIEAELNEMNRKTSEQSNKSAETDLAAVNQENSEVSASIPETKVVRRKAVRGGAGRRARKAKETDVENQPTETAESHGNKENSEKEFRVIENGFVDSDSTVKRVLRSRKSVKSTRLAENEKQITSDTEDEVDVDKKLFDDRKPERNQIISYQRKKDEGTKTQNDLAEDSDSDDSVVDQNNEPVKVKTETGMAKLEKSYRIYARGRKRKYEIFECNEPDCDYKTNIPKRLERHTEREHIRAVELKCNVCLFTTKCNKAYTHHMKEHIPGPPFNCDEPRCTYSHEKISVLLNHRVSHYDDRPYVCTCGMRFKSGNTLIQHKRTHSGKKNFECPECKICFATKSTMLQHIVIHSNSRPYLCDECGFATKFQSHLTAHKRIHSGDVFNCQFPNCDYSTPKRSTLKSHMKFHLGIRAHTCQECGRSFIEKSHLVRHEKLHTGKKLKCEECTYITTRNDKLREHIIKHHSEEARLRKEKKEAEKLKAAAAKHNAQKSTLSNPVMVKWDHGGYSIGGNPEVMVGDNYFVLRDQLTSNDPIQQPLIQAVIPDPSITSHSQITDIATCQADMDPSGPLHHDPSGHLHHDQSGPLHHDPSGHLQHDPSGHLHHDPSGPLHHDPSGPLHHDQSGSLHNDPSGPLHHDQVMEMVNSPGMDHVQEHAHSSSGLDVNGIHESHTYTINSSAPMSQQQTEYGGLGAFMALF